MRIRTTVKIISFSLCFCVICLGYAVFTQHENTALKDTFNIPANERSPSFLQMWKRSTTRLRKVCFHRQVRI